MYTSNTVQNDLIQCESEQILQGISEEVSFCGAYSIMFDETTDRSHSNIMCFVVRYLDKSTGSFVIREDFLDFVDT